MEKRSGRKEEEKLQGWLGKIFLGKTLSLYSRVNIKNTNKDYISITPETLLYILC